MDKPKVSIIMPVYNRERYIQKSITSVLNQTYKNWELIIVDDCSTDNTAMIVKSNIDDRIRLLSNNLNVGASVSRNKAIGNANGDYIAFLDSDDIWLPEKLEKQLAFMISNNYDFSYTNYNHIDNEGNDLKVIVTGPKKVNKSMMFRTCYVGCLTVMYNAKNIGLMQTADIRNREDYALWLKVIKKSDCYLLDQQLASYRRIKISLSHESKFKLIKCHYDLFKKSENMNAIQAVYYTFCNIFYGVIRKIKYTKKLN